jgi:hypothetical protein
MWRQSLFERAVVAIALEDCRIQRKSHSGSRFEADTCPNMKSKILLLHEHVWLFLL